MFKEYDINGTTHVSTINWQISINVNEVAYCRTSSPQFIIKFDSCDIFKSIFTQVDPQLT